MNSEVIKHGTASVKWNKKSFWQSLDLRLGCWMSLVAGFIILPPPPPLFLSRSMFFILCRVHLTWPYRKKCKLAGLMLWGSEWTPECRKEHLRDGSQSHPVKANNGWMSDKQTAYIFLLWKILKVNISV